MSTVTTGRTLTDTAAVMPQFACAEVWGGNRPINSPLRLPGIVGHVFSHPCDGGRGGDIHYVSICGSGLTSRLCVADVAGHGQAIANVSGVIHRLMRQYMNSHDETRILGDLNRRLMESAVGTMTTAASVGYVPPLRLLSVSYAGHPPGWLYRMAEDRWTRLLVGSNEGSDHQPVDMPLGIEEGTRYSRRRLRVRVGDRLLLLTDGVLEAPAPGGGLYGEARLERVLHERRRFAVDALVATIVDSVIAHTANPKLPHDDVTLMLLEFVAGPKAFGMWEILRNRVFRRRRRVEQA